MWLFVSKRSAVSTCVEAAYVYERIVIMYHVTLDCCLAVALATEHAKVGYVYPDNGPSYFKSDSITGAVESVCCHDGHYYREVSD